MKNLLLLLFAYLLCIPAIAQDNKDQDPKAKAILNKLSEKNKAFSTISVKFTSTLKNKETGEAEKQKGEAILKGKKYYIETEDGQVVISDGRTLWTYLKDENEVMVDFANSEDNESAISPEKLFTIWEEGFKYKLSGTETIDGKEVEVIKLFPIDPAEKKFHTIIIKVDTGKNEIVEMVIKGKDEIDLIYKIDELIPNKAFPDSKFKFDKSKYPGCEEIDLR